MNRRSFILSGSAGLALIGSRVAAQRASTTSTVEVSELTDAELDYTESGFELESHDFEPNAGSSSTFAWEQFNFITGEGKPTIDLFTGGSQDFPKYMEEFTVGFDMIFGIEEHAYADREDGGYSAFSYEDAAIYLEYQLGAFPDVDLMITFTSKQETFQDEFAKMQTIMLGGAAPCYFTEESKVQEIVFAGASQTTTTTNTRSTRGTSNTGTSNTSRTSGSNTSSGGELTEADFVDMIIEQHDQFHTSYDLFMSHLAVVADDTTTDAEVAELFSQMYDIALEWMEYPGVAEEVTAPASVAELNAIYQDWAGVIGQMGSLFDQLHNGADTIDAFIAAVSEWELLDAELEVALEDFGFRGFKKPVGALTSIRNGLQATWRSVH